MNTTMDSAGAHLSKGKPDVVENLTDSDPAAYFNAACSWEASLVLSREHSEARAWRVAAVLGFGFVIACAALITLMPLKENTPYVIRVDNATGVPDIVTAMQDKVITGDEVMDKYWLAKYVTHRETYDWYTLQTDYDTVGLLSSAQTGADYSALFEGDNALQDSYANRIRANVKIISVVPTGSNTGTVRFIKTTQRVKGEAPAEVSRWVATIAFEYQNTERMKESVRLINPFGFKVNSYRVDSEMAGDQ